MWRRRTTFVRQVLVASDTLVSVVAYFLALTLREFLAKVDPAWGPLWQKVAALVVASGGLRPMQDVEALAWMLFGLIPLWVLSFSHCKTGELRGSLIRTAGRYLRAVVMSAGGFILLAFLAKLLWLPRTFVLLLLIVQFALLLVVRVLLVEVARMWRRRTDDGHRVAIVGTSSAAVEFAAALQERSPIHLKLLGYISVLGEDAVPEAQPQLGHVVALEGLLDALPIDEVAFAVPGKPPEAFRDAIRACDERGVAVLVSLPHQMRRGTKMEIANVTGFGMPMLGLRRTPTGEARLALKRMLDVSGGLVGLLLAAPIMIVAALAIRLDSPGPILFTQIRAGRNGRTFTMYKFRSMVPNAEAKRSELMQFNEMGGPVFKMKQDPRITRVGRLIRKTSIDELPQFFNILLGDMSLVGPRPPLPSEVQAYEPWQRRRLSVKPGLTGLWQVSGRNQVDFEEWMQLDLEYIDTWSLWLDLKIILRTIPAVLFQKGSG